jgi:hypothetical protein
MRRRDLTALLAIAASATLSAPPAAARKQADPPPSTQVGRYRLQSNAWVNLHQRLMYEARFGGTPPTALDGDGLAAWKKAVEAYRSFVGRRSPILDDELIRTNEALAATNGATLPDAVPEAAASALGATMPLYRAAQWDADDRANRFWIAVAGPLLASAGEELAAAHSKAYGVPFPTRILVDVTAFAWEFGAYTVGEGESAHAVIAGTLPGNQGFAALEMLLHEPSHAIVGETTHAIGTDLTRIAGELGVRSPRALWHAILFYTSSELTRRALAERGVGDYRPVILGMYERGFAAFRKPLESHWQAFLDGTTTRDAALRQILAETTAERAR